MSHRLTERRALLSSVLSCRLQVVEPLSLAAREHRVVLPHTPSMRSIEGWVFEDNVVRFLGKISGYIGYDYDALDEAALTGALDHTDDESTDRWFSYPLMGTPPLTVSLARAVGGSEVSARIQGEIDPILAARFETILDLL